jgi:hypothetical protein
VGAICNFDTQSLSSRLTTRSFKTDKDYRGAVLEAVIIAQKKGEHFNDEFLNTLNQPRQV